MNYIPTKNVWVFLIVVAAVSAIFYGWQFGKAGVVSVGELENIEGIPFPEDTNGVILVTEKLAHTDVFLPGLSVAKQLELTVQFVPGNATKLEVGVRENSFWLSYPRIMLFDRTTDSPSLTARTVIIPLTDKLVDRDGSVDVMFFATVPGAQVGEDEGVADATAWQVHYVYAATSSVMPSWSEVKDFIKSKLKGERPV